MTATHGDEKAADVARERQVREAMLGPAHGRAASCHRQSDAAGA